MQFDQPHILNYLWGIIALVIFLRWAAIYRAKIVEKFVEKKLLKHVMSTVHRRNHVYKYVLIVWVFVFGIIAMARPQWGFEWQEVKRKAIDIIVVIDTSKSMLTQDVKPNRLERTKLAVKDLIKKLKGDRIGLIAFSGDAFLLCPLTSDYNGFLLSLNDLGIDSVPRGGTNLEQAIRVGLESFEETNSQYKTLIVVTDGDNLEGDPTSLAKKARDEGVKIYTIGIGTREGELIQTSQGRQAPVFLKDSEGNFIKSRLNEPLLKQISIITDGAYVKASGAEFGLDLIYERDLSKLEKRSIDTKMQKKFYDRYQWPLALATIFLVVETCLPIRRKVQR